MKQASITIYLALILTIMMALFATCIEGARMQAIRLKVLYASDSAALSCFAEYQRELFDKYDLLFVDISYGGRAVDSKMLNKRVNNIFRENCFPGKNLPILFRKTALGVDEADVEVNGILLATDDNGKVFKEAACTYIKSKYGIEELEMLRDQIETYENEGYFSNEIELERLDNEKDIKDKAVIPKEENADGEIIWEEIEVDNPADDVNNTRKGVLNLVVEDPSILSSNCVDLSTYASKRENILGNLELENNEKNMSDLALEEIYFSEYVLEKSGNYRLQGDSEFLTYETEYIIVGGESDVENLRKVVNRILLIRETSNVAHILSDQVKMNELEVIAAGLAAVTTLPELQPIIKYSLVLAWGYAESVSDVKRMLNGERVAFYKTSEQWKLSLENMLAMEVEGNISSEVNDGDDVCGLSYEDYLRMLVYVQNEDLKIFRMMDVIEMNIRSHAYDSFRLDTCSNIIDFSFVVLGKNGKTYKEKKRQRY